MEEESSMEDAGNELSTTEILSAVLPEGRNGAPNLSEVRTMLCRHCFTYNHSTRFIGQRHLFL